jgi:hypothetical protein
MARECKAKRDERRFGRPERLADRLFQMRWNAPLIVDDEPSHTRWVSWIGDFLSLIERSTVISASQVCDYIFSFGHNDKHWSWSELPPLRLSYPSLFVELAFPGHIAPTCPMRSWGCLLTDLGTDLRQEDLKSLTQFFGMNVEPDTVAGSRVIAFSSVGEKGGEAFGPIFVGLCQVDEDGRVVGVPWWHSPSDPDKEYPGVIDALTWMIFPSLLSVAFMNFKDAATLIPGDLQVRVNRERKKHGLRPFVRYHTINIDPMKRVLRTEGQIETQGLKRALHQCRGHFVTYTDNFMGRPLDKPMTFWRPAHVRGSLDEGVVISDYNVKAPANP